MEKMQPIEKCVWEIPVSGSMKVPIRVYANERILPTIEEQTIQQAKNVASLPGIVGKMQLFADAHVGYGMPVGGTAAFDAKEGIISPSAVGFDVNCGMRLLTTNLTRREVKPKIKELMELLFKKIPVGVGRKGTIELGKKDFTEVITKGAKWCVQNGYGWKEDLERTEEKGCIKGANPEKVSQAAMERGTHQLGTLGSGNHYLEVQLSTAKNIFDSKTAKAFGITGKDQIVAMIHCLPGKAKILTEFGTFVKIKDLEETWENTRIVCFNERTHQLESTEIEKFFKLQPHGKVFKIKTKTRQEIIATDDHPLLTKNGLKLVSEIKIGDELAVLPFEGVEYELPTKEIISERKDLVKIGASERTIKNLEKKRLLPLQFNSEKLPVLIKLLGYMTGDGWLGKNRERWTAKFIGAPEDLEEIRRDVASLGYKATPIHAAYAKSVITYADGKERIIKGTSHQITVTSLGLPMLFYSMGAPFGNKSKTRFNVPKWLFRVPLWMKRLYLAAYFGAEMTKPKNRKKEFYRFDSSKISLNKIEELHRDGKAFLDDIKSLLKDFGIESGKIIEQKGVLTRENKKTIKLVLQVLSEENNQARLWRTVGFEYNKDRAIAASHALHYLNYKRKLWENESQRTGKTKERLFTTSFKFRSPEYPRFVEYIPLHQLNPPTSVVWDPIEGISELIDFKEPVYDLRVKQESHTFVADHFVVGNCGSRGFGHQVCTDYGKAFLDVMGKYGITVPDRDLACAPFQSEEGQEYYAAMACAANNAFANRQMIMHLVREGFEQVFKQSAEEMKMQLTYDVAHNMAKLEKHWVEGKKRLVVVHRKGSTRAFGPNEKDLPKAYQKTGQPVIVGGSMETDSYLCAGTEKAMRETFGSTLHGSGRTMSRQKAKQEFRGEKLQQEMLQKGIFVKAASMEGLAEEAGKAYKNINDVIESMHTAGISLKVAALQPIGNIKG